MSCEQEQANVDSCEARLREASAKLEAAKAATPGTWLASTQNDAFNQVSAIGEELKEAYKQLDACREKSKRPEKPWRPWAPTRLGMLPRERTRPIPSPRSVSTRLFGLAAIAALAAVAAFAGAGPFATQANAVGATTTSATAAASAAAAQPFVPRPNPVGSGTISFALPPRYGTNPTITEYQCQNAVLPPDSTPGLPPPSGLGPGEPAIGVRGVVSGGAQGGRAVPTQTFFAFFTATRTFVGFQDSQFMPPLRGGPLGLFEKDKHVAGTANVQDGSGQLSGTVTADITCTTGPTAAPANVSVAPAAPVATTSAPAAPAGNNPLGVGLSVIAVAAAAGGLATRSRYRPYADSSAPHWILPGEGESDPRNWVPQAGKDNRDVRPHSNAELEKDREHAEQRTGLRGFQPTPPPQDAPGDDEGPGRVPLG